ncbi:MAG TPA: ATP-binding cassette domain-containing protein, partial [Acidimicrobiales bacterium]|nr:ATP-binding cassette domain-containing protein [Acidimicrobiales bacterium]
MVPDSTTGVATAGTVPEPSAQDLVATNVSKTFAGQKALDQVNLDFRPGEVHCLLGQNGSGKSTMVKILSGFHSPDPGSEVVVGGQELIFGDPDSSRYLGLRFVHQQLGVIDNLSAVENAALGRGFGGTRFGFLDHKEQARRTRELLSRVGVTELNIRRPLSEARAVDRTAVAIARAVDPTAGAIGFLFLDEPTAALPPVEVDRLFELIAEVKSHGTGIVYVSHRLDEVFRIGDRVSVLRDAKHVGTFEVANLDKPALIELIVGEKVPDRTDRHSTSVASVLATGRPDELAEAEAEAEVRQGDGAVAPTTAAPTTAAASGPAPAARLSIRGLRSAQLHDVSFDLAPGEVLGIAGLAGSGRESLVYAILGAQRSRATSVAMAGTVVGKSLSPRTGKLLGIVLAPGNRMAGSAVAQFSLRENITLPVLRWYRKLGMVSKRQERDVTRGWLADLGVAGATGPDGHARMFPQLSGGNQQKVIL